MKQKLVRITTVPMSLDILLKGQLAFMKDYFEVVGISAGPEEELEAVGLREGIPVIKVNMTRSITPFKDLLAVWRLFRIFKRENPFIVHTHTPKAGTVGMLAAKFAGVPHRLHTVAGMPLIESTGGKRFLLNFVEKVTYSCATKVYPNSPGLAKIILTNKFANRTKIKVIGDGSSNGIDTTYFSPLAIGEEQKNLLRREIDISSEHFVFIFVGRLVKDKGINELIEAFETIAEEREDVKLILVGPLESELDPLNKKTLAAIEKHPDIISVGYQKDVRPYFAISDTLVFPSYREGFPNVVLQAGSMGLPSIVTDINGSNEIIEEGKNGTIIPVKDSDSLEKAMKNFLTDQVSLNDLRLYSRKKIVANYDQKKMWKLILEEYRTFLPNP